MKKNCILVQLTGHKKDKRIKSNKNLNFCVLSRLMSERVNKGSISSEQGEGVVKLLT